MLLAELYIHILQCSTFAGGWYDVGALDTFGQSRKSYKDLKSMKHMSTPQEVADELSQVVGKGAEVQAEAAGETGTNSERTKEQTQSSVVGMAPQEDGWLVVLPWKPEF